MRCETDIYIDGGYFESIVKVVMGSVCVESLPKQAGGRRHVSRRKVPLQERTYMPPAKNMKKE
jgi:hypothetical protein